MDKLRDNLVGLRAPEFPAGLVWLNSEPLALAGLRGSKAVLIDFWTYSCVNCLRTLPYLKQWHEQYAPYGLVIVGVHSPEFAFEKNATEVKQAVEELGVSWPVVLDSDHRIWRSYANAFWPRKLLVDAKGFIAYDHIGEGAYQETEQAIQRELKKLSVEEIEFPEPASDRGQGNVCFPTTPEYYLGSLRGTLGNASVDSQFNDSSRHEIDRAYLQGVWKQEPEFTRHARNTDSFEDYLLLKFRAAEVNLVMGPADNGEIELELKFGKEPLPVDVIGQDVKFSEDNRSIVEVKEHRVYNLIDSAKYFDGQELKIFAKSDQLRVYAFTFSGCVRPIEKVR